jgi:hypothetical protein
MCSAEYVLFISCVFRWASYWRLHFSWFPSWVGYSSWWQMYVSLSLEWSIPTYIYIMLHCVPQKKNHVALYNCSLICLFAACHVFILLGDCVCKTCYRQFHVPHMDLKRTCACGDSKVEGLCKMCYLSCDVLHPAGGGFVFGHKKESFAYCWMLSSEHCFTSLTDIYVAMC